MELLNFYIWTFLKIIFFIHHHDFLKSTHVSEQVIDRNYRVFVGILTGHILQNDFQQKSLKLF